jgi:hypothetical protein
MDVRTPLIHRWKQTGVSSDLDPSQNGPPIYP